MLEILYHGHVINFDGQILNQSQIAPNQSRSTVLVFESGITVTLDGDDMAISPRDCHISILAGEVSDRLSDVPLGKKISNISAGDILSITHPGLNISFDIQVRANNNTTLVTPKQ